MGKKWLFIWIACIVVGIGLLSIGGLMGGSRALYIDQDGLHMEEGVTFFGIGRSGSTATVNKTLYIPSPAAPPAPHVSAFPSPPIQELAESYVFSEDMEDWEDELRQYIGMELENGVTASMSHEANVIEDATAAFSVVNIDVVDMQVRVEAADYYGIRMEYPEKRDIRWDLESGILTVKDKTQSENRLYVINWEWGDASSTGGNYITLYVPADALETMSISTVSGSIVLEGLTAKTAVLNTVSGEVKAKDCTMPRLSIETVSGAIKASGLTGEQIALSSVSGRIDAGLTAEVYNIKASTVSASISVDGETITKLLGEYKRTADTSYTLEAETVSGKIALSFE